MMSSQVKSGPVKSTLEVGEKCTSIGSAFKSGACKERPGTQMNIYIDVDSATNEKEATREKQK